MYLKQRIILRYLHSSKRVYHCCFLICMLWIQVNVIESIQNPDVSLWCIWNSIMEKLMWLQFNPPFLHTEVYLLFIHCDAFKVDIWNYTLERIYTLRNYVPLCIPLFQTMQRRADSCSRTIYKYARSTTHIHTHKPQSNSYIKIHVSHKVVESRNTCLNLLVIFIFSDSLAFLQVSLQNISLREKDR